MNKSLHALPSISEVIKINKLMPSKKLGQNFILDTDITDRIVRAAGNLKDKDVLEIGPGAGTLTRSVLASNAASVYAVEMDPDCIKALEPLHLLSEGRLNIIHADALRLKEEELITRPTKIIANLPYNIGTELIIKWLSKRWLFESVTVMLQKEVAERIVAAPSTPHYGRLSVICRLLCETEKKFDVAPEHFYPAPKVVSSIITLTPRAQPLYPVDRAKLEQITQLLFSQRRKMIRAILKNKIGNLEQILQDIGITPTDRPENLTLKNFCDLANVYYSS